MESKTYIKNLRISPKKLRFFLPEIKKLTPKTSLDFLFYTNNKAARFFYQVIKSALSNARNTLKVEDDLLEFKTLIVEEGQKLKRYRAGSRGTAKPYRRRFAHIKIILVVKKTKKKKSVLKKPARRLSKSRVMADKNKKKVGSNLSTNKSVAD